MSKSRYGNRPLLALGVLLVAQIAFVALRQTRTAEPAVAPRFLVEGDVVGDVRVVSRDGATMPLRDVSDGAAPSILLVFHSGCPKCEEVAPEWRAWLEHPPADVNVFAVTQEDLADGERYASGHGWSVPVLRIAEPAPGTLDMSLVMRTPWLVVTDENGVVTYQNQGEHLADVDEAIALLRGTPAAP